MSVRALPALTLLPLAVLLLAMLVLAAPAEAREARLAGPGGDGSSCSTDYPTSAVPDADPARAARRTEPEKPVSPRGADSDIARPPRWHSFLPGMFR